MATFQDLIQVGMEKCARRGPGTEQQNQEIFSEFVDLWNRRKEKIREMSKADLERQLECP